MFTVMVVFHILVCTLLVIVVLMQSAKGEGLAGAFGGGGSGLTGAVFGGRGAASFLSKATTVLAIVFMLNCGVLAFMSTSRSGGGGSAPSSSVVTDQAQREMEQEAARQQALPPESTGVMQMPMPSGEGQGETEGELPPAPTENEGQ